MFLDGNQLAERWRQLPKDAHFIIIECGFGTGLNFLAAWQLWDQLAPSDARLHFVSIEKHPLSPEDLETALASWPQLQPLAARLLQHYPLALPGIHQLQLDPQVSLTLGFGEITEMLDGIHDCDHPGLQAAMGCKADALMLDGFAPAKNPEMWSPAVVQRLASLSKPGTSFATFTAAGQVKRGLAAHGFRVNKIPGHGRKRDMLVGALEHRSVNPESRRSRPAWHCARPIRFDDKTALVIGAGLAGCHTARALANSGWRVTVLDHAAGYASGASGNPAGILYTRLAAGDSDAAAFSLEAYLYACRHYRADFAEGRLTEGADGCLNGMLQLGFNPAERSTIKRISDRYRGFGQLVSHLDAAEASTLAGIPIDYPALYFPGSGWLAPRRICGQLLEHPAIELVDKQRALELNPEGSGWRVQCAGGMSFAAAVGVICSGIDTTLFRQLAELPIKGVGGQISYLAAPATLPSVSLCHSGYAAPTDTGGLCFGASFRVNDATADLRVADHRHNLQQLQQYLAALVPGDIAEETLIQQLQGRAAVRCTTPDYLPVIGPVPRFDELRRVFQPLAANAKAAIDQPGEFWPGLYVNTGHGSKGLATAPIAGACIAALVNQSPRPLHWKLMRAVSPARFAIRSLIRSAA